MRKGILFIVLLIMGKFTVAQVPGITWQKSLGGSGADEAKSVQPTRDGGYIVGGTTSSNDGDVTGNHGGKDCWVVKLNAAGSIEWQKCYGGTLNETFGSIRVTADGGYIMGATTQSNDGDVSGNHGDADAWAVKLDSAGTITWQQCFGSAGYDALDYIEETFDNGYICKGICGTNDGDLAGQAQRLGGGWMFKLSASRNIQWQTAYSDGGGCGICGGIFLNFVRQTTDSGYVFGYYGQGTAGSGFIGKRNSAGNGIGSEFFSSSLEAPISAVATDDGGCMALFRNAGQTGAYFAPIVKKYNSALIPEWQVRLDTCKLSANIISRTADNGFILGGSSGSAGTIVSPQGGQDYGVAKLSGTGAFQWQRALGSNGNDVVNWVESTEDSGYILAGKGAANSGDITGNHGDDDFWVVKLPYSSPNFAVIASAGANGTISPNGGILYPLGHTQKFTITPYLGYHITNVLVDGVSNAAAVTTGTYTFDSINSSHTISATFAINTYTITASSGSNGIVTPSGVSTVTYGTSKTYTITPATGYSTLILLIDSIPSSPVSSLTFSNISANHTIRAIFANPDSAFAYACPFADSAQITSNVTGTSYTWQLNDGTGNGYSNLYDGLYFRGTRTSTLTIKHNQFDPQSRYLTFGYKYRCVVDNSLSSQVNVLRFQNTWQGTFGNNWEIPQNWSCGRIPDSSTDVVIPAGSSVTISTNITVRSLTTGPGANITLASGGNLTVLH